MKLEHIIFSNCRGDEFEGKYNLKFAHDFVEWNNEKFIYHSSGLCRKVFISPCKTFVLKIPIAHCGDRYLDFELVDFKWKHSPELRELGRKSDGQVCLFDYDPIIDRESFVSSFRTGKIENIEFSRYEYERVIEVLQTAK